MEFHEITSLVASVALESRKKKGAFKHTGPAGTVRLFKVLCIDRFLREGPFSSLVPETLRSLMQRFWRTAKGSREVNAPRSLESTH